MAVLSLSGGADSATLLAYLCALDIRTECFFFNYGQQSSYFEQEAAKKLADYYNVNFHILDIRHCFKEVNVGKTGHILAGDTVVRGRNLFFASLLSMHDSEVYMGVNKIDFEHYPDCRPVFFEALNKISDAIIITPFIHFTKLEIINLGKIIQVPYNITRSCYSNTLKECNECGACIERRKAGL
jgi:7-cyano-7-deazaguanine synthase